MSSRLKLLSPAKLNLFFRVLKKREDGYHEIASLYQAVTLCDVLTLEKSDRTFLTSSSSELPCDESNLILKAYRLFQEKTKIFDPVKFHIEKKIPTEAGLGGGSSNAATTLWGLNQLFGCKFEENILCEWSKQIGSDVPFFFSSGSAFCTGRGERISSVSLPKGLAFTLAKPKNGLSTPLVYKNIKPHLLPNKDPKSALSAFLQGKEIFFNDLETSAFELMPSLSKIKDQLLELGFSHVVMTGSGTAFFCQGSIKKNTPLENVAFYNVRSITKEPGRWYELIER